MTKPKISVSLFDVIQFSTYFNWTGNGFGQFSLYVKPDKTTVTVSGTRECMSKESLREALHSMIDNVINALPEDKQFDADHFSVEIPYPPQVLAEQAEWELLLNGDGPTT